MFQNSTESTDRKFDTKLKVRRNMITLDKSSTDLVLVLCALAVILGYHLLLYRRILRRPSTTMIGYENQSTLACLRRMAHATAAPGEAALAVSVIADGVSASTTLASLCLALPSLIGAWALSGTGTSAAAVPGGGGDIHEDESSQATATVKYASLLACFLASFTCFVQSAGCYVNASFLMSALGSDAPVTHVQRAVLLGGGFWEAGLRVLYLATTVLVWVAFGSVPMLGCSVLTVAVLHLLDSNSMPLATALAPVRN